MFQTEKIEKKLFVQLYTFFLSLSFYSIIYHPYKTTEYFHIHV